MFSRLTPFSVFALSACLVAGAADEKKEDKKKSAVAETDKYFAKLDADSDGKVTGDEFAFLPNVMKDAKRAKNNELAAIFGKLDKNKDKSISSEEFRKITEYVKPKDDPKAKVDPKKADPKKVEADKKKP